MATECSATNGSALLKARGKVYYTIASRFPDDFGIPLSTSCKHLWIDRRLTWENATYTTRPTEQLMLACIRSASSLEQRFAALLAVPDIARSDFANKYVQEAIANRRFEFVVLLARTYHSLRRSTAAGSGGEPFPNVLCSVMRYAADRVDGHAHAFAAQLASLNVAEGPHAGRPLFHPLDSADRVEQAVVLHTGSSTLRHTLLMAACKTGCWKVIQYWVQYRGLSWSRDVLLPIGDKLPFGFVRPSTPTKPACLFFLTCTWAGHRLETVVAGEAEVRIVGEPVMLAGLDAKSSTSLLHKACSAGEHMALSYWLENETSAMQAGLAAFSGLLPLPTSSTTDLPSTPSAVSALWSYILPADSTQDLWPVICADTMPTEGGGQQQRDAPPVVTSAGTTVQRQQNEDYVGQLPEPILQQLRALDGCPVPRAVAAAACMRYGPVGREWVEQRSMKETERSVRQTPFAALWPPSVLSSSMSLPLPLTEAQSRCVSVIASVPGFNPAALCTSGGDTPLLLAARAGMLHWVQHWIQDDRVTADTVCPSHTGYTYPTRHVFLAVVAGHVAWEGKTGEAQGAAQAWRQIFMQLVRQGKAMPREGSESTAVACAVYAGVYEAIEAWLQDPTCAAMVQAACRQVIPNLDALAATRRTSGVGRHMVSPTNTLIGMMYCRLKVATGSVRANVLRCFSLLGHLHACNPGQEVPATSYNHFYCAARIGVELQPLVQHWCVRASSDPALAALLLGTGKRYEFIQAACDTYQRLLAVGPYLEGRQLSGHTCTQEVLATAARLRLMCCTCLDFLLHSPDVPRQAAGPALCLTMECGFLEVLQAWGQTATREEKQRLLYLTPSTFRATPPMECALFAVRRFATEFGLPLAVDGGISSQGTSPAQLQVLSSHVSEVVRQSCRCAGAHFVNVSATLAMTRALLAPSSPGSGTHGQGQGSGTVLLAP